MLIALINESTKVTNAECETMCQAIQIQLDLHVLPAWNMKTCTIKFYADKTTVPGYAWLVSMLDDSTQAGALGYHSVDSDKVDGFIFASPVLENGGTVLAFDASNPTQYTVSATLSHEVCEMIGDRYANGFSIGPQISEGNLYAQELCDAVENDSYGITVAGTDVAVSNFLFPSYFNAAATSPANLPFDYMKKLTAPFTMSTGGYMIVATLSNEAQVTGRLLFSSEMPEWKKECKRGEFSRNSRLRK